MDSAIAKRYTREQTGGLPKDADGEEVCRSVYKFSLRWRTDTMCPPSENIHKKHTDKLSAGRPRLRADERDVKTGAV